MNYSNIVVQGAYFAIRTKNWLLAYFGKPHCAIKHSHALRPANSLPRYSVPHSRESNLRVVVDSCVKEKPQMCCWVVW